MRLMTCLPSRSVEDAATYVGSCTSAVLSAFRSRCLLMGTWRPPKVTSPLSVPWRTAVRSGSCLPLSPASSLASLSMTTSSTLSPVPTAKASRPSSSSPARSAIATVTVSGSASAASWVAWS